MDWTLAISRNRNALRAIIGALFALAGLASPRRGSEGRARPVARPGTVASKPMERGLPRHILAAILAVLRPVESAVRRLILIAALTGKFGSRPLAPRAADSALAARLQA